MIRSIIIGVLAVAVFATGFWGYREHQEKNAILIQSENNYQRAFHDLSYHVDLLHDEIGSTLAMNSRERLSPSLVEVWRLTSEAQNDIGQLPLALTPFSKTEEFLYKVGSFSYKNAIRDLEQDPLTDEEYESLQTLYEQSGEIQQELRKIQSKVLNEDLKWMDVDMALAAQDEPLDNSIVNGFKIIDEKVEGFSEVDIGAESAALSPNDEEIAERLEGEEINERQALQKAKEFLDLDTVEGADITETGDGLAYEAYSLTIPDPEHNSYITMDITKKGGNPVWTLNDRDVNETEVSLGEASENAKEFLERNDFDNMQLVNSKQYNNVGVFNFVEMLDNVRIYSDATVIEVGLDDGEVLGYEGFSYLENNKERQKQEPELSKEEAEDRLNPHLDVMEHHLAIIENELEEEVLCHEFYGVINNDTFRIFINAENGREERVEKMANTEVTYN
ncbi:germination protein YpeB [Bacillus shivajii]|uniref:germination protein YpeB n=1 Tax=Bacillus shivajii TaxID=1983719 RepID=UPI001CFB6852|nr:germination protein YpeB [Bacillus shivajii]UCZ54751.1 germination protein YpeB [Bacillus shivajii]